MAAILRGLATLAVAGLTSLTTFATLGHMHLPAAHQATHTTRPVLSTVRPEDAPDLLSRVPTPGPSPSPAPVAAAPEPAAPVPPAAAPPARSLAAAVVIGSAQQALINADRAAAGLPPLTWSSCLSGIAAAQSRAMVARGAIFHGSGVTQDFGCGLGSGQTGENVGYWSAGVNDAQLNTMFMNSAEHRANIMGPYRFVGTAWAVAPNGYGYISVEFG